MSERKYVTTTTPEAKVSFVPEDGAFEDLPTDLMDAEELEGCVELLLAESGAFRNLDNFSRGKIKCFWQRNAPKSNQNIVWGHARKAPTLLYQMTGTHFVICVAADIARTLTEGQLEALLFHELCHCGWDCDKKGRWKRVMYDHHVTSFLPEIDRYGLWVDSLVRAGETFAEAHQLSMFEEVEKLAPTELTGLTAIRMTSGDRELIIGDASVFAEEPHPNGAAEPIDPSQGYHHEWKGSTLDIYAPDGSFRRAVKGTIVCSELADSGTYLTCQRGEDGPGGAVYEFIDSESGEVYDTDVVIAMYETVLRERLDDLAEELGETTWIDRVPEESTDREQSEDAQGQAQLASITPIFAGMAGPSDPF